MCVCAVSVCALLSSVRGSVSSSGEKFLTRAKFAPNSQVIFLTFNKFKVMFVSPSKVALRSGGASSGKSHAAACSALVVDVIASALMG